MLFRSPQRRRRIFLVVDFGGQCAGEILFEREGLSRSFAESRQAWQGFTHSLACRSDAKVWDARRNNDGETCSTITGDHENRITDYTNILVTGVDCFNQSLTGDKAMTMCAANGDYNHTKLRRLTPIECGRLDGMPDWWCDDIPHSDTAEYKMWGNGMALPNVLYVMEGVVSLLSVRLLNSILEVSG